MWWSAEREVSGITVLLATWQGERFLEEQLQSLRDQTGPPVTILARDDASADGTRAILERWAQRYPGWLDIVADDGVRRGATGNFTALLAACTTPYALFCDQDDRWHTDKVARSWAQMQAMEDRHGAATPLLVHGDAQLIDDQARPLSGSLAQAQHHRLEDASRPERMVMHNYVTGCTTMFNRALMDLALPIPASALWHDWWMGLLACLCGKVEHLPGMLLDYRQHGANALGAGTMRWSALFRRFPNPGAIRTRMRRVALQAGAARERCGNRLDERKNRLLESCAQLPDKGWMARRTSVMGQGMWMPGIIRNAALLAFV
jgi:glycosyltransferase involved in cell wall biosynthesis